MSVDDKLAAIAFTKTYISGDFVHNPRTIQEKLAHIKIFGTTPAMTLCADKLKVKQHVRDKLGVDLCVPLIREYADPSEVQVEELPSRFVLKCNHGCGYNIVVPDKDKFNREDAVAKLTGWLAEDFYTKGYELQYKDIPHRCFAEQYVESSDERIKDYKFLCFNGVPRFVKVEVRTGEHNIRINCYDMDFRLTDIENKVYPSDPNARVLPPAGFNEMRKYATLLSKDFDFVRVDFMQGRNRFYLGELTFSPGNARMQYRKAETSLKLGSLLRLSC